MTDDVTDDATDDVTTTPPTSVALSPIKGGALGSGSTTVSRAATWEEPAGLPGELAC